MDILLISIINVDQYSIQQLHKHQQVQASLSLDLGFPHGW